MSAWWELGGSEERSLHREDQSSMMLLRFFLGPISDVLCFCQLAWVELSLTLSGKAGKNSWTLLSCTTPSTTWMCCPLWDGWEERWCDLSGERSTSWWLPETCKHTCKCSVLLSFPLKGIPLGVSVLLSRSTGVLAQCWLPCWFLNQDSHFQSLAFPWGPPPPTPNPAVIWPCLDCRKDNFTTRCFPGC